jgi:trk system potassium uptake protein TrkA
MKLIILGCGRVGSRLATLMEMDGHDVSIIDPDPAAFDRLPADFSGQTILGTGIDVDVLKSAGIESADGFAAVTNFDNTNIMACEIAKEIFGIDKVLARIYDPGRETFYHELGLETVCPTTLVSNAAHNILSPDRITPLHQTTPLPRVSSEQPAPQIAPVPAPTQLSPVAPAAAPAQAAPSAAPSATQPVAASQTAPAQPQDDTKTNGRGIRGLFRP